MYKFFVQTSLTHNMVTTDLKMQDPSEAKRILFHSGKLFQATAIENYAKWSNPPYGGWRVLNGEKDFAAEPNLQSRLSNADVWCLRMIILYVLTI